jgi:hypothetical protein
MRTYRTGFLLGGVLVAGMAPAANWDFGVFGGAITGAGTSFEGTLSGTGLIIDTIDTVVLAQMTHTWVGDLKVTLTHVDSGTSVNLFHHVAGDGGSGGDGDSSDLGPPGNYTFRVGQGDPTIEMGANGNTIVPDGFYRPAEQADPNATVSGANSVDTNFNAFVGLAADATWRMTFVDRFPGADTGNLVHFELHGTGSPVPEPATFAALGLGALALLRRRRAAKA